MASKKANVVYSNPLNEHSNETGVFDEGVKLKVDDLSNCHLIDEHLFDDLFGKLYSIDNNQEKLDILDGEKNAYLFTSEHLIKLLDISPSIKTQLTIVGMIGPRLTDPKAKSAELIAFFRYAEEKHQIEEILKARAQILMTNKLNASSTSPINFTPRRSIGGRGGGRGLRNSIGGADQQSSYSDGSINIATSPIQKLDLASPNSAPSPIDGGPRRRSIFKEASRSLELSNKFEIFLAFIRENNTLEASKLVEADPVLATFKDKV